MKLLSHANPKTLKSVKKGVITHILHLAPSDISGVGNTCPKATDGCRAACLNTAGRGGMFKQDGTNAVQAARIRKTQLFFSDRAGFMDSLVLDIKKAIKQADKLKLTPVFRLNGTSDISWEKYLIDGKTIFETFPSVQFYDYTKVLGRKVNHISNYHLTFSQAESNAEDVLKAISQGYNIAVVFDKLPEIYNGLPVYMGDDTDMRYTDPKNHIIGLTAKGKAKKDTSGFVVRTI